MRLDVELIHYFTKDHFRVLTAVEMGMKNHEFVPNQLIESLSGLKRSQAFKTLQFLLKHKCLIISTKMKQLMQILHLLVTLQTQMDQ